MNSLFFVIYKKDFYSSQNFHYNDPNIQKIELSDNNLTDVGENALRGFLILNLIYKRTKETEDGMVCDLSNLGIGDLECGFIANHDRFDNLTQIYLELNKITEVGVCKLAKSKNMESVTLLSLDRNKIGDKGIEYIVESDYFKNLNYLMIFE